MSPAHVTVAPLAEHLPGWLLLLAFVALICVANAVPMGHIPMGRLIAARRPTLPPEQCPRCQGTAGSGHQCSARRAPSWAHIEEPTP